MMIKTLASTIAKIEGKKSQVKIGDIREILAVLSDLLFEDQFELEIYNCLVTNGRKRANKKLVKKRPTTK